jgi:choline dehydrogenase-like flavoprotein
VEPRRDAHADRLLRAGRLDEPARLSEHAHELGARALRQFGFSPNGRGRREDYPINDRESPIHISNFNAVGGSTILYAAHFPRFHPSDFRVRTLDGSRRRLADRLRRRSRRGTT